MQRRTFFATAVIGTIAPRAVAQSATTRILVGFAPGGSVDALARMTAEHIQSATQQTVIVENRTGAAGRLAIEQVKAAAPDGQMLVLVPQGPMTLFTHVFRNLRFDPTKDFVPVSRIASGDFALTIGPMVIAPPSSLRSRPPEGAGPPSERPGGGPSKDFAGFRAWLKTAGDKASYGSPGAGTLPHFIGVSIARALGTAMTHVPYKGSALSMNDLAGGNVAAVVSPVTEALELHKAGRVRIVATTGAARSTFVDGVPTLKELGVDVDVPLWFALYAPAATPPAVLDKLRAAVHAGLATPAAKDKLGALGLVPAPSNAAELLAIQARESAMWATVVKASGFTPED